MRYNVKWKGYEKKSDRTWETEENLELADTPSLQRPSHGQLLTYRRGARLILESYWKKIGGKPTVPTKISKKRSRQSLSGNGASDTPKKQKRGRKSNQTTMSQDQTPEPPAGFTQVGDDDWKPPPPDKDAWDPLVQAIDTIERDEQQELWAYLVWNDKNADGRFYRSKARVPACNQACPQRVRSLSISSYLRGGEKLIFEIQMLQFYEKHVVFTQNRNSFVDNNGQV